MATLTKTEINVYSNAAGTTQIGNTLVHNGPETTINVDNEELGDEDAISPGENYWVKVRVTDSDNRQSYWTPLMKVTTTPEVEAMPASEQVGARVYLRVNFNPDVINVEGSGFLVSDDENFSYYDEYFATPNDYTYITLDKENTDYFFKGWVRYNGGLTTETPDDLVTMTTTEYFDPVITIINQTVSYDSLGGTVNISPVGATLPINGNFVLLYNDNNQFLNSLRLPDVTGESLFEFVDGENDYYGNTITILPESTYKVIANVGYPNTTQRIEQYYTTSASPAVAITVMTDDVTSNSALIGWLVEGNSAETPLVSIHISGGGRDWYPTSPGEYGQRFVTLNGLDSGTTYTVYGEAELTDYGVTSSDTITFTTL